MEEFLCERRSTISFKDGDVFRKYYKYAREKEVISEQIFSNQATYNGVNCPKFLSWGYCDKKKMFYSEFEFKKIQPINKYKVDKLILEKTIEQLYKMPKGNKKSNSRNNFFRNELCAVSKFLPMDIECEYIRLIKKLFKRKNEIFIHGDYSFENIGWDVNANTIIVFDFQNSGYGVMDWDKSYLLSTIPDFNLVATIPDINIDLMKIITALKYGRGIRKNFEIEERTKIYEYWWK